MWMYYFAIFLVVASNVGYHISQKSTPAGVNPALSLLGTYMVAAIFCLLILPFFSLGESITVEVRRLNWTCVALGISIVGLEMGFLLAYRAGWNISLAQFYATTILTLLLIPIGLCFFQEKITMINVFGIILCLGGFILLNHK
jgi:uncharacterized membrane protein